MILLNSSSVKWLECIIYTKDLNFKCLGLSIYCAAEIVAGNRIAGSKLCERLRWIDSGFQDKKKLSCRAVKTFSNERRIKASYSSSTKL